MPIWHQSPKLTPRYFLETPRLFGYPLIARLDKYTYLPVFILQQEDDSLYLQYRCGLIQRIQWTSAPYQLDLFYRIGWACPSVIFTCPRT